MKILVCNAGSTSLKFKLFNMPSEEVLAKCNIERVGSNKGIFYYEAGGKKADKENLNIPNYATGIKLFLDYLTSEEFGVIKDIKEVEKVGFKTVLSNNHYGIHELNEEVLKGMEEMMEVAPVHNSCYLEAIKEFREILPLTTFIGAFETAFHQSIPMDKYMYGVPYEWVEKYGIRKMGYHGASQSYIANKVSELNKEDGEKLVVCHLGGSGSICAVKNGLSIDTSFGLSLQEGLIQSNRAGSLDSFIIPYLMKKGLKIDEITEALTKKAGLLGISGVSNDLRDIYEESKKGNKRAKLAIDMYCTGIVRYIGSFAAEMNGLNSIAFTGGIGQNASYIRSQVLNQFKFLGLILDEEKNSNVPDDFIITAKDSLVRVYVIPTDEEVVVARKTYEYK